MLHDSSECKGSHWKLVMGDRMRCRLRSSRTGQCLCVHNGHAELAAAGHKEQVLHLDDEETATWWQLRAADPNLLAGPTGGIMSHSYEVELERLHIEAPPHSYATCCHAVQRDGVPWAFVETELSSEAGSMSVLVRCAASGVLKKPAFHLSFDPLTGCVRGTDPPSRIHSLCARVAVTTHATSTL